MFLLVMSKIFKTFIVSVVRLGSMGVDLHRFSLQ